MVHNVPRPLSFGAMRNLQVLNSVLVSSTSLVGCRCIAVDCDTKLVYCATECGIVGIDVQKRQVRGHVIV